MTMAATLSTKEQIIVSARDIYLEEGLSALSMRKVASKAGLSPMAAYRHFENKDDLLSHVILEGFQIFERYFYRSLQESTPWKRLEACAQCYYDFAMENARYYEVMFMSLVQLNEINFQDNGRTQIKASQQFLIDRVNECKDKGIIKTKDSRATALHLWAHCHGLISLHLAGRLDHIKFDRFYKQSTQDVLNPLKI